MTKSSKIDLSREDIDEVEREYRKQGRRFFGLLPAIGKGIPGPWYAAEGGVILAIVSIVFGAGLLLGSLSTLGALGMMRLLGLR